ncbi:uncharacterized protein LOC126893904 [Daktulosphaira vitifoliae]|uniref:uncharacterized protein LOC126893904 n=1 Tax=Daktulosphaira vitifoliae TaxID=58002 RepID=UPI0021A9A42E|nr:uncharacterized protein LOC126893904 [Daktulosphaira vitifoliae]
MEFYSITFVIIVAFVLKPYEAKLSTDYHDDYKNYINTVISYIHSQIVLNEKQNLKLNQCFKNNISFRQAFLPEGYMNDFRDKYSYTINVLNFKYTGILKKFLNYIDIILQQCKQFRDENLWENFICCVTSLVEEVKNSKTMFENLYNAMKFISEIDVRYVFNGNNVPNAIVDEIDFFKQFVLQYTSETVSFDLNSLPNLKDSETKFKNLNEFYAVASEKVNIMFQNNNLIDTFIETNSITNQITECSNKNDSYLVYLTCSNLNAFYNETIDIWYKNLGFDLFFNPIIPKFIPPIDLDINQNDGIKALNILRRESGWKKMEHISIIYNGKQFSVDWVIKDEINYLNFQIKKEHVIQLLRCRYTEIIKNYYTLLSAILFLCNADDNDDYNHCLIELYNSFNKSKLMLEGLHLALITLNKLSISTDNINSQSNLQNILNWVTGFLRLLKNNELFQDSYDEQLYIKKMELINNLLTDFSKFFVDFRKELRSDLGYIKNRCLIKKPFYDKFKIINDFRYSTTVLKNAYPQYLIQKYHTACNYFVKFCEDAYTSCYEDMGFRKIYFATNA